MATSIFAVSAMTGAQAATVLSEGFENVAGLAAQGWVFTNASSPAGQSWFQGVAASPFTAKAGTAGSYAAANFLSTTAVSGVVDNWMISPEVTLGAGARMTFYTQASDVGFFDQLEVLFSSGSASVTSSFTTLLGVVGDATSSAYPIGGWAAFTVALPNVTSGRFAFHYTVADASNASYIGIDSVTVTAVPEPASLALLGLGLAVMGFTVRRRRSAS